MRWRRRAYPDKRCIVKSNDEDLRAEDIADRHVRRLRGGRGQSSQSGIEALPHGTAKTTSDACVAETVNLLVHA